MLSSLLAALAGVLLAPLFAQVERARLLHAARRRARRGGIRPPDEHPAHAARRPAARRPAGSVAGYLPTNSVLAQGLRPSLPFVVLFLLLLFWPGLRKPREMTDPLAGVDPPPPAPAATIRRRPDGHDPRARRALRPRRDRCSPSRSLDDYWVSLVTKGAILGLIFLSFVIITGLAGQISLCQATFAAVGAFTTGQLVTNTGMSVLLAMVIGARHRRRHRRAARATRTPPGRHLPRAGDPRLRPDVRDGAAPARLGQRRTHGRRACPVPPSAASTSPTTRTSSCSCSSLLAVAALFVLVLKRGHHRSLPRRAARQRDRGLGDRHQPVRRQGRRLRGVGRHRRLRRRAARLVRGPVNYEANITFFYRPRVGRARGHPRRALAAGRHHRPG